MGNSEIPPLFKSVSSSVNEADMISQYGMMKSSAPNVKMMILNTLNAFSPLLLLIMSPP